ncbi:hypothetical protein V9L05_09920 [Bernardetia sp. Wsw4-3y2]|uniref:hypothetical protein n=1 Tax=Bernardetia sp. Wsw4-3y2 TaxID=3127471 RepID=UPI0030CD9D49
MSSFSIKIISQNWISDTNNEMDLCSHGQFELKIGNEKILTKDDDLEWTISTSTLNLLRCIESNHLMKENFDLILHCGELGMVSCPIGIYLDLIHDKDEIIIENIVKQYGTSENSIIKYSGLKTRIPKKEFAVIILKIAEEVLSFFEKQPKRKFFDESDKVLWQNFWIEFNNLYEDGKNKYCC